MKMPHEKHGTDLGPVHFIFLVDFAVKGVHKKLRGSDQNFNDPPSNCFLSLSLNDLLLLMGKTN